MTTTASGSATPGPASAPGGLDAVQAGHADVEQAHVRAQPPGQLDGPPPVGGLADDLDVRLGVEDHREPGADDLLVVGDEHPDAHAAAPGARAARRSRSSRGRGSGPASQVPPSRSARSIMPISPYPARRGRAAGAGVAVVADPQAHRRVVGGDADLDAGGVPGVPPGVGDRLLREAVDRGADRRREVVDVAVDLHVDRRAGARPARRAARGRRRAGWAPGRPARRGAGRGPSRASRRARATPRPRSRAARRPRRPGAIAAVARPGLGPDRHRRDVMGDGVVQVAGQPLPFEQLDLVELALPRPGPVPQRRAEGAAPRTGRRARRSRRRRLSVPSATETADLGRA